MFVAALVGGMAAVPVSAQQTAQQTIVIGDDNGGADGSGPKRSDSAGVVINDDVLDSLGRSGGAAPGLPPSTPYGAPGQAGQAPVIGPGAPGTAYRLPGTGQLVISRPSTLLFPPPTFPSSRLTVPAPAGRAARTAPDTGTAESRLLVPKPAQPSAPDVARPEPAPAATAAVPREPVTPAPGLGTATAEIPPATEAAPAPAAEPTPAAAAPMAPTTEPVTLPAPPAVAELPTAAAPAAEPPVAPLPAEPSLQDEPATAAAPSGTPAVEAEPKATPQPEPSQSAALPSAAGPVGEMRLTFDDGSAELTSTAMGQLDSLAKELLGKTDARVQLLAYAKASEDGSSRARRLSLSRALAVRAYLIEKGIRSTRMDVRALGSSFEDGPADRVDVLPQESTQ